jgi:hypothetical protein
MAFEARDLMINVLPDRDLLAVMACTEASPGAPRPPECKAPSCAQNSAPKELEEEGVQLADLAVLREQLQLALRS